MKDKEKYYDPQKYCDCGEPITDEDDMCLECWKESPERCHALREIDK